MAKEYDFLINAHPSIYKTGERQMKIYFSEPDKGVNVNTGILLFISGFGANANSNVYKKMRNQFADKYNLVTVQCDYFGWQFMQTSEVNFNRKYLETVFTQEEIEKICDKGNFNWQEFLRMSSSKKNVSFSCKAIMDETLTDFNDMGIMQAVDNLSAVLALIAILQDNHLEFNIAKIMIYGQSHGAYLAYLCNAFAPKLFSMIIDNSAWLFPRYIRDMDRYASYKMDKVEISVVYEYLAKALSYDNEILELPFLYRQFDNNCNIISFHGISDELVSINEKEKFCGSIRKIYFNKISGDKIDGEIFKSTKHGLDADFIKLIDYVFNRYNSQVNNSTGFQLPGVYYSTRKHDYQICYDTGMPMVIVGPSAKRKNET